MLVFNLPLIICSLVVRYLFHSDNFSFSVFSINSVVKSKSGFKSQNSIISGFYISGFFFLCVYSIAQGFFFSHFCWKYTPMTKCGYSLVLISVAIINCSLFVYIFQVVFFLLIIHTLWYFEYFVWNTSYKLFMPVGFYSYYVSQIIIWSGLCISIR